MANPPFNVNEIDAEATQLGMTIKKKFEELGI
jgi:hypothetical protein